MIKVLYGIQNELIESWIKSFIRKEELDNVIKIDYTESDIDLVIDECSYLDLFGGKKIILLYNANFLTSKETLESKKFEKFIINPNMNTYLFLIVNEPELDSRKKFVKIFKNDFEVIEFNTFTEYQALKYVKETFNKDGYNIEDSAIKKMVEYLSTNFGLYENEIKKLEMYKLEDKNIELKDVLNLTSRIPEDNVFKLVDAVINNNKEEIFKLYKDIKSIGTDEIVLIALLASQFRFMYQVSILLKDGKGKSDIISLLNAHPYKTEITMKKTILFKTEKLENILYELSLIDIKIKSGEEDKSSALENFFLKL